jgi:2-polyprenyl-3-methyl-5-hydroxy-6-metoxy-1,4-benzoquinol methylase
MKPREWNEVAERFLGIIDESRTVLVFPRVRDLIARSGARRLLDFGGGNGSFALSCSELSLQQIATFDPSEVMTKFARRMCQSTAIEVIDDLGQIAPGAFDVVVMNAVWMCFETESDALDSFRTVSRLLPPQGRLICSVTHPCFRDEAFSTFRTNFNQENYLQNGTQFDVFLTDGSHSVTIRDTHWNLEAMSGQLEACGYAISRLHEIPDHAVPMGNRAASPWLIIEAIKTREI